MSNENHLQGTIYEKLSIGPLRFDTWLRLDDDEEIIISSFRHPIVALKYFLVALVVLLIGFIGSTYSIGFLIMTIPTALLVVALGLLKIYSRYYVLTDKQLIKKKGIFTDDSVRKSANRIQNQNLEQSFIAKLISSFSTNYADIHIQTASGQAESDLVLDHVPNPNKFDKKLSDLQKGHHKDGTQ